MRGTEPHDPIVWAYIRLSREDQRGPGATSEKLEARAQQCRDLAVRHGLALPEHQILRERESGGAIANRPQLLQLLHLCSTGQCTHVITPAQDRLLRGYKRDEAVIEEALCRGEITLITQQDVTRFDGTYNPLVFDVLAAAARFERRAYTDRRKAANRARLSQNQRYGGRAPYGYRTIRPTYDHTGRVLTPAAYDVVDEEYAVVVELFRRFPADPLRAIARDLNERGVPTPTTGKRVHEAALWTHQSIRAILLNPFYAGYHAQRTQSARERQIHLAPSAYVLAQEPGDWPCPIDRERWEAICGVLDGRGPVGAPARALLSGLIYCGEGHRMTVVGGGRYSCGPEPRHHGMTAGCDPFDRWAIAIADQLLDNLPADFLPGRAKKAGVTLAAELGRSRRSLADAERTVDDLMRQRARYESLFGAASYERSARKAASDLEEARRRVATLEAETAEPDRSHLTPLLTRLRTLGVRVSDMDRETQRAIVVTIIRRIDLLPMPPDARYQVGATITVWDWCRPYAGDLPPLRRRVHFETRQGPP